MGVLGLLRWEWKLQSRSLRFRVVVTFYLVACVLPSLVLWISARRDPQLSFGDHEYLVWTVLVQGFLTTLLALLLAGSRAGPGPREELFAVLRSAALSNTDYQLRRWAALALLTVGIALLPLLAAAVFSTSAGAPPREIVRWALLFAAFVATPACLATGAWLTLVALGGGELMAVILTLLLVNGVPLLLERLSDALGWALRLRLDVFGQRRFEFGTYFLQQFGDTSETRITEPFVFSVGAFDPALALAQWWPRTALVASLCLALAVLSPLWLQRSKRHVKPLRLGDDHPLRSTAPRVYGFVLRGLPDAGVRLSVLVGLAVLLFGLGIGGLWAHGEHFRKLAERRYAAERLGEELAVTSPGLRVTGWRSEGRLDGDGSVDLRWRAVVEARDTAGEDAAREADIDPPAHLAFTVDPFLELTDVAWDDGTERRVHTERRWDRWLLRLEPPLRPGESATVSARVRGTPRRVEWGLPGTQNDQASFATRFRRFLEGQTAAFARSLAVPAISTRRIHLGPGMLGPVPRYTSWRLTPPPATRLDVGEEVPPERERVPAEMEIEVELDFDAPPGTEGGVVLVSSCGGSATAERWVDGCRLPPHLFEVRGGPFVSPEIAGSADGTPGPASVTHPVTVAALPAHRHELAELEPSFRRLLAVSHRAWPGQPGLERLAVIEWPRPFDLDPTQGMVWNAASLRPQIRSRLIVVPETYVAWGDDLDLAPLLGSVLAAELSDRRDLTRDDARAFRAFLGGVMMRRMGAGSETATLHGKPWVLAAYQQPFRDSSPWRAQMLFFRKMPALLVELEERLGLDVLVAGLEDFLARGDDKDTPAGTFEELFELLAEHAAERPGAATLDAFFHDHWVDGTLPVLRLAEAEAVRLDDGWRVHGRVENEAGGHAHCPLAVRTEGAERKIAVDVPPAGDVDFELVVEQRPHTVLLDPRGRCLRRARTPETPDTRIDLARGGA